MHLLLTQAGQIADGSIAVDLDQSPGEMVVLSAAASDLALLARARERLDDDGLSVRLANLMQLTHNLSVDLYLEKTASAARVIVVRLLGGLGYWSYGIEQLAALTRERGIAFAVVPGDENPDPELASYGTLPLEAQHRLWQYCTQGGPANAEQFLRYCAHLAGHAFEWREPAPLPRTGLYKERAAWREGRPAAAVVFYRALLQADDVAPVDALISALDARGLNALPIYVNSLKDAATGDFVQRTLADAGAAIVLNCTGFAISTPGADHATPFDAADCPVLQVILSGGSREAWDMGKGGLAARDLAMSVALPEVDGRIVTRAVSFKETVAFDEATQSALVRHAPEPSRIDFVTELASRWVRLRRTPANGRRVAIVLANYPNKDGRIANGVGLDTPESVAVTLGALADAGYDLGPHVPTSGKAVMDEILAGPTNAPTRRDGDIALTRAEYQRIFAALPETLRTAVTTRWGAIEADPFFQGGAFHLPAHRHGNLVIAVQPARGYNIDPTQSYHDPDLAPPHGYLAFYFWLRHTFDAHAVIHFGKHGNLEWLPGKSIALSDKCFPEAALGPLPHLYPFIVNDPGEGTQAKRRAQAVIIDHLTPPLTRAETYGELAELERLVDEYYLAAGMDARRLATLRDEILTLSHRIGLAKDLGLSLDSDPAQALVAIDRQLCELKEMQIRDGLHIFGRAPDGAQERDLMVALARPKLLPELAREYGLGFDPLDCDMAEPWIGPRPEALVRFDGAWRTAGDTVERLERLAAERVSNRTVPQVETTLRPALHTSAENEVANLLRGLDGRFVSPGPSGAPTRGRLDVLPTGRNFYSVDCRAVPTPAAWALGWKSATLLIERHFQDHGEYPKRIAMSAWGTANMRTGGDDVAQALALMGVKPVWDKSSARVTGFEVLPASVLGRPRVDVLFRISGFFRDAFPAQVDLLDSAARAVAALGEDKSVNPLTASPGHRVFGSMPGAYGAGLQALIDEGGWENDADLANAYLAWGGFAYGNGADGAQAQDEFRARLAQVQAIVQNQDNREHDLLDSDDYYQFEGGLAATVRHLSGKQPMSYHPDHSRPETPKIRTLSEEIARVVRARAANPKWIAGVMRHGYKGAFEIAATVDYLFAFAATARCVEDHHFDMLFDAYLADAAVRGFMAEANPAALAETAARFSEAIKRGLWHPRSNSARDLLASLTNAKAA